MHRTSPRWRVPIAVVAMTGLTVAGLAMALPAQAATASADGNAYSYAGTAWGSSSSTTEHWSDHAGDTASINFTVPTGSTSSIGFTYAKGAGNGIAGVSLDGGAETTVDEYARTASKVTTQVAAAVAGGAHTLTVRVTGNKNASASWRSVSVYGATLGNGAFGGAGYVPGGTPSPTPTPMPTPTPSPASGPAFYVDPVAGNDANDGKAPSTAWKTVAKVNATTIPAGTSVLFLAGQTYTTSLVADNPGTSSARVVYGSYGSGAKPIFDGGGSRYPVQVSAAFVTVQDIQVQNAGQSDKVGLPVYGTDALLQRITATHNGIGVEFENGAHRGRLTTSQLVDNTVVIDPDGVGSASGSTDDYGANGLGILQADSVEVDHNTISGNIGNSGDFGQDGSAVEIYGATNAKIHHNVASGNQTFSELGDTHTSGTTYYDNLVTASVPNSIGLNLQGAGQFGPVLNTKVYFNTIVLTGSGSQGFLADSGATFTLRNNIISAPYVGWTAGTGDEGGNVFANGSSGNDIAGRSSTDVTADPKFVGGGDYHLQSGSPAIDRATVIGGVTTDLDDKARSGAPDSGAYEYTG